MRFHFWRWRQRVRCIWNPKTIPRRVYAYWFWQCWASPWLPSSQQWKFHLGDGIWMGFGVHLEEVVDATALPTLLEVLWVDSLMLAVK
jgi:hypothetical protein